MDFRICHSEFSSESVRSVDSELNSERHLLGALHFSDVSCNSLYKNWPAEFCYPAGRKIIENILLRRK